VDTVCTRSDRHIDTIVDEDARPRAAYCVYRLSYQGEQLTIRHVALADLNQMNAGSSCRRDAPNQRGHGVLPQAPAVGDHADDGMHEELLLGGAVVE
jgi:hypothetical protein